ncbi:MAG: outer membrane beta-barrel protein [Bacteroidaceae bacterium]|nr:outer membrane beta-barrel protein [Bacteroidaceae bacterium]
MKRILLAVLLLAGVSAMQAQESKFYVGGTFGFTWSKVNMGGDDMSGASVKIMPEFGYNLNDKFALGVSLGYSRGYAAFGGIDFNDFKSLANTVLGTASDVASDDAAKLNSFRFAPYVRYTFWQPGKLKFFVEGSMGYVHVGVSGDQVDDQLGGEPALNVFELNIRPGLSFDVSKHFTLQAKVGSLGYIFGKEKQSEAKIHRFGFDVDTYNILLGMNYNF